MEYREHNITKVYRPRFGYGHVPGEDREEARIKKGEETMPRPAGDPLIALIAVVILLLAFLIGSIVASRIEIRESVQAPAVQELLTAYDSRR